MQFSFWEARWRDGQTGFHESQGNANLRRLFREFIDFCQLDGVQQTRGTERPRVLVPLCGKTLDLSWLRSQGFEVVGVEFVESAARSFFEEAGVTPQSTRVRGHVCHDHDGISIIVGDFFELLPSDLGRVDLVYDRAALVAIEPERRHEYIEQLWGLTQPEAGLFLITFEHDIGSGPPFSIDDTLSLCERHFALEQRAAADVLDAEPRFRERGASYLREVVWFGRRL